MGELGRYPLLIRAITQALKYEWHINTGVSTSSLVSLAMKEMREMCALDIDSWYTRVSKIKKMFSVPKFSGRYKPDYVGKRISTVLKDKFSSFWKQEIKREKLDTKGVNRNKLRFYQTIKSSFTIC